MDWTEELNVIRASNEQLKAEIAVVRGTACEEEQKAGNGPCGICIDCYKRRLNTAMGLIERLAQLKGQLRQEFHFLKLSEEAFQFIMSGPGDTKAELERELIRTAKSWADDSFNDDRALARAVEALIKEEKRREPR